MSKLIIVCENCRAEREVDEKLAGSILACTNCQESIRVPLPDIEEGTTIGGFVLEKQLGFGSMGEVWLAHQKTMDRKVALKLLSREFTLDSHFVDRFLKEVKISAKMDHPNMITAFDAGCDNDIHFLAITFVDGSTLEDLLEEANGQIFDEKDAVSIMIDIASALKYAWDDFQIIHRDLKPANIMIDSKGVGKLMDLGISKSTHEEANLTMTGTIIGTPYYMSPEQGIGERDLDFHTDIYSLGATLYHLVTGEVPFQATTALGIVSKHITEPFPPPQDKNPDLSDHCSALLETMMAKAPEDRQDSWDAVLADMKLVLDGKFPSSKKRPDPGDSLVMRATPSAPAEEIPGHARETVREVPPPQTPEELDTNIFQGERETEILPAEKGTAKRKLAVIITASSFLFASLLLGLLILHNMNDDNDTSTGEHFLDVPDDDTPEHQPDVKPEPPPDIVHKPPVNPPDNKVEDPMEKRIEEMWKFASNFAKENPDKYDLAITNFHELSNTAGGTKYKMMADVEISRLEAAKGRAISNVIKELKNQSREFEKRKDYLGGVELLDNYSGDFFEETMEERKHLAKELQEKADIAADKNLRREEELKVKHQQFFKDFSAQMIAGNWLEAKKLIVNPPEKVKIPQNSEKVLGELINMNKSIFANLEKNIGKTIYAETDMGKKNLKIKRIKDNTIYIEEKVGRAVMQKKFPISRLTPGEKAKRAGFSNDAAAFYLASEAFRKKDIEEGMRQLKKTKGFFGEILGNQIKERLAEEGLANFLRKINIRDTTMNPELIAEELQKRELTPIQVRKMAVAIQIYRKSFGNTRFAQENEHILEILETSGEPIGEPHDNKEEDKHGKFVGKVRKIEDLHRELKKLNRDYDGRGRFMMRNGRIIEVDLFEADGIDNKSLNLIKTLPLKVLDIGKTGITDISALKDMDLVMLNLSECKVSDLSPLKKMKSLRKLALFRTNIKSIEDLKDLDLHVLDISETRIKDLSPLEGSNIKGLMLFHCPIRDYGPLEKCHNLSFLEPLDTWRHIPGKEYKADRPQDNRMPDFGPKKMHRDDFHRNDREGDNRGNFDDPDNFDHRNDPDDRW